MNRIQGKSVVVTGATAGIGRALAHALAAQGAHPVLVARREERLSELQRELHAHHDVTATTYPLDVRDRPAIDAFVAHLDAEGIQPDVLVNNAGLGRGLDTLVDGRHEDWDEMIDTNIKGVLNVTRAILPGMVARDRGHIVNIGSIAGHMVYPKGNVYNATKYAVRALTEATNIDLVGTRIRVSSVDPGLVETEFSLVRFKGDEERASAWYDGINTLLPEDIADAVCYVINAPPHVNVLDMVVMPTDQRSPYVMARETD